MLALDFDEPDNDGALAALGARVHPTIVLIDGDGRVVETLLGRQDEATLRAAVEGLVAGATEP